MHILFSLPDIRGRPTGGNIFNRRVIADLEERSDTTVSVVEGLPAQSSDSGSVPEDATVHVVDSLLLEEPGFIEYAGATSELPLVLMVHYLHLMDPDQVGSEAVDRERYLLSGFDHFITTSSFAAEALREEGVAPWRMDVVKPGLASSYRRNVDADRQRDPPIIFTAANLLPGKGIRRGIEILEGLEEHNADLEWEWHVAGDDTLNLASAKEFRARAARSSVGDRIRFLGAVHPNDMRALYDRSTAFMLPSRFETCSMATMEALARGLPVIAYGVGGLPDLFAEQGYPGLIPPGDQAMFRKCLGLVLQDADVREQMRQQSLQESEKFVSWTETGEAFRQALSDVGSAAPRSPGR